MSTSQNAVLTAKYSTSNVFEFGGAYIRMPYSNVEVGTPPWNRYYGACVLPGVDAKTETETDVATRSVVFGGFEGTSNAYLFKPAQTTDTIAGGWTQLMLKKPVVVSEEESAKSAPPSPRLLPLMVGLSKNKFLVVGGRDVNPPHTPLQDAFVGEIIDDTIIKWQPVYDKYDPSASAVPYHAPNTDDVFTCATATFMRADDNSIIAVMPKPVGNTRDPSVYDANDGARITGQESRQILGMLFFDFREVGVFAEYFEVPVPKTRGESGGYGGWPSTALHSLKMAPLSTGYAFGIQIPRSREAAKLCHQQTWLLGVFKTAEPVTTAIGGFQSDGSFTRKTIPFRFDFVNLGGLPNSPPLSSEPILFSTGARMHASTRNAVVAVYGGQLWGVPQGNPKTGTVSSTAPRMFVGTFCTGSDGKHPKMAWLPEFEREFVRKAPQDTGYSLPDSGVQAAEIAFDPRDWGVTKARASVVTRDVVGLSFVFYGGTGRKDASQSTFVVSFLVPKKAICDPNSATLPKEWSANYPQNFVGDLYKRGVSAYTGVFGVNQHAVASTGTHTQGVYPSLRIRL